MLMPRPALSDRCGTMLTMGEIWHLHAGGRIVAEGDPNTIGGRERGAALIRFTLPATTPVSALPLNGKVDGHLVVIEAPDLTRTLHTLTGWALDHGVELEGLTVSRPSLEDVYLELVGR